MGPGNIDIRTRWTISADMLEHAWSSLEKKKKKNTNIIRIVWINFADIWVSLVLEGSMNMVCVVDNSGRRCLG